MLASTRLTQRLRRNCLGGILTAFVLAVLPCQVFAQGENAAQAEPLPQDQPLTPPVPIAPPTTVEEADALTKMLYTEPDADATEVPASSEGEPTRPWKLTLHARVSGIYDDNIYISARHRQADFVSVLSPGLKFAWGDWLAQKGNFVVFDYTLSGLIFADHPSQDTIEQEADADAQWALAHLTFTFHFGFQDLSSPDIDVGNRTRRRLYQTALLNKYDLSEQTSLEANLYNNFSDYETRLSSDESTARFWFDYHPTPKLTFGPGLAVGYLTVEDSPSQTYERILGRVTYAPTDKLSFEADGGLEIRQTEDGDRVNPVLNLTGSYLPFEATEFRLSAYRKVETSASLAGENYTSTGVSVEASRTIRASCDLVMSGGYNHSDYQPTIRGRTPSRDDDYFFVRPSVRFAVTSRVNIEIFYLHQENDSTRATSAFRDNQAGARVHLEY